MAGPGGLEFTEEDMRRLEAELAFLPNSDGGVAEREEIDEENRPAMLVQDADVLVFSDEDGLEFLAFRPRDPEELSVLVPVDEALAESIVAEMLRGGLINPDQLRALASWAEQPDLADE